MVALFALLSCGQSLGADLQKDIETALAEERLTGIGWTLVDENGDVTTGSAGMRDNSAGLVFLPDTRFHVGSLTKALLATGVLRLATEGRIELDAPARRYLSDRFVSQLPKEFSKVTVRHLLDHTAGLNDAHLWQMFSERAVPDAPLIAAFPDPRTQLRIRSQPGARFSYSNMGYTLLGMVIESVADDRYEDFLDEYILAALGMHDSTFQYTTQKGADADPRLAWGHVDDGSRFAASPIFLRPAGQFTTTTADLAVFSRFLLGTGEVDGMVFIDPSLMTSRAKAVGTEAAEAGLIAGYALGLGRRDRHGVIGHCHGGNIAGFLAMLCVFPEEQKAFAYSVNTDSETANYGRLDRLFVEALDVAQARAPVTSGQAGAFADWSGHYLLSPNRFQSFQYLDTLFGFIRIAIEDDSIELRSLQAGTRLLQHTGAGLFSANDRSTISHVFYRGPAGEYRISDGFQTFEKTRIAYLIGHWSSLLLGLAGLVWLLLAGAITLVRKRSGLLRHTLAPAFIAAMLLLLPVPFFFAQSFMALGDVTLASGLLAFVTFLLPVGMLFTVFRAAKESANSKIAVVHGIAAILVLQWSIVLAANGMLPLRLWA